MKSKLNINHKSSSPKPTQARKSFLPEINCLYLIGSQNDVLPHATESNLHVTKGYQNKEDRINVMNIE